MPKAERLRQLKKKETINLESRPAFQKAKSLFGLHEPDPATEEAWKLYISNRRKASQLHDELVAGSDDEDEDSEDEKYEPTRKFVEDIDATLTRLEKEMGVKKLLLSQSRSVINCEIGHSDIGVGEDAEETREILGKPSTSYIITRIFSPTRPSYIDVHFDYHWYGYEDIGFKYRIGFKVYSSPAKNDYPSQISRKSIEKDPVALYTSKGWRPFAHGHNYEEIRGYNVLNVMSLDSTDVQNITELLWGPQVALPEEADDKAKLRHRRLLVNSIRVVLAGAGIDCKIACLEKEEDQFTTWGPLEGEIKRWMAREIRKSCGFQLKRDLEDAARSENMTKPKTKPSLVYGEDYDFDFGAEDFDLEDFDLSDEEMYSFNYH